MTSRILLMALMALQAFSSSFDRCITYPVVGESEVYHGKVEESSDRLLFGFCPDYTIVNNRYVARLKQLIEHDGVKMCMYRFDSVLFACR